MKCDELRQVENPIEWGLYYDKFEVDAAIAELKDKLQLDEDEMAGFLKLEEECGGGDLRNYIEELKAENEQLKAKLETVNELVKTSKDMYDHAIESLKASHYAEMVDAGMRERRLERALWLARSEWARSSALSYHLIEDHPDKDAAATYKRKANKWEKVKDKCLKKAEQYR